MNLVYSYSLCRLVYEASPHFSYALVQFDVSFDGRYFANSQLDNPTFTLLGSALLSCQVQSAL